MGRERGFLAITQHVSGRACCRLGDKNTGPRCPVSVADLEGEGAAGLEPALCAMMRYSLHANQESPGSESHPTAAGTHGGQRVMVNFVPSSFSGSPEA